MNRIRYVNGSHSKHELSRRPRQALLRGSPARLLNTYWSLLAKIASPKRPEHQARSWWLLILTGTYIWSKQCQAHLCHSRRVDEAQCKGHDCSAQEALGKAQTLGNRRCSSAAVPHSFAQPEPEPRACQGVAWEGKSAAAALVAALLCI